MTPRIRPALLPFPSRRHHCHPWNAPTRTRGDQLCRFRRTHTASGGFEKIEGPRLVTEFLSELVRHPHRFTSLLNGRPITKVHVLKIIFTSGFYGLNRSIGKIHADHNIGGVATTKTA